MIKPFVAYFFLLFAAISTMPLMAERPLRYISIDGGGLKALAPVIWLKEIQIKTGKPLHQLIDGVIGNSAGAVIAASLCTRDPFSPEHALFDADHYATSFVTHAMKFPVIPAFSVVNMDELLNATLHDTFHDAKMSEAFCHLLIGAFDRETNAPFVFDSNSSKVAGLDLPIWEAVRASSSIDIPIVGPFSSFSVKLSSGDRIGAFSDLGLQGMTDPTDMLKEMLKMKYSHRDIVIYSLGTEAGTSSTSVDGKIKVVRIVPNFAEVLLTWPGYLRSYIPILVFRTSGKIMDIRRAAETVVHSPVFEEMLKDFKTNL